MTHEFSHLYALEDRLGREKARLASARSARERAFREHEIRMCEREIESEKRFLASKGITVEDLPEMSDDELLAELGL